MKFRLKKSKYDNNPEPQRENRFALKHSTTATVCRWHESSGCTCGCGWQWLSTKPKFTTHPDGANEKGLLSCPTADGVEVTADSVLAVPGPEMDKIRTFCKSVWRAGVVCSSLQLRLCCCSEPASYLRSPSLALGFCRWWCQIKARHTLLSREVISVQTKLRMHSSRPTDWQNAFHIL